jgi:protein phosphatase
VTRALGGPDPLEPDFFSLSLAEAGRIILCSDGVTDLVRDDELAEVLGAATDPRDAADQVVAAALAAGGVDNATAVVVDVVGLSDPTADPQSRREGLTEKLGALP